VRTLEADVTLVRDEIHAGVNAADTRIFATTPKAMVVWLSRREECSRSLGFPVQKILLKDDDAHHHRTFI
jgi:hypothetical protein